MYISHTPLCEPERRLSAGGLFSPPPPAKLTGGLILTKPSQPIACRYYPIPSHECSSRDPGGAARGGAV